MNLRLGFLAIFLLAILAVPALAQQEERALDDTATLEFQAPLPDTGGVTTRQGIEGEAPAAPPAGRAAEEERAMAPETGAEMPTTASPLELVTVAGALLITLGLGLRYLRRES